MGLILWANNIHKGLAPLYDKFATKKNNSLLTIEQSRAQKAARTNNKDKTTKGKAEKAKKDKLLLKDRADDKSVDVPVDKDSIQFAAKSSRQICR